MIKKTDIIIYDFYFSNRGKMWKFDFNMKLNMIFSVWLRTGSNPAEINWFGSHTGIVIYCIVL